MSDAEAEKKAEKEAAKALYDSLYAECMKRDLSNSENLDKSVLTYSSAGVAFSLGFLKDFVPIDKASCAIALYTSWVFFNLAIVLTIGSLIMSQLGLRKQLKLAYEYYIERDEGALKRRNVWSEVVTISNYASAVLFVVAVGLTTLFVSVNLKKANSMANKSILTNDGALVPTMQKIPTNRVERGANVPPMQKIPTTQPSQPTGQPSQPQNQQK